MKSQFFDLEIMIREVESKIPKVQEVAKPQERVEEAVKQKFRKAPQPNLAIEELK